MVKLIINGRLSGLNEYTTACRTNAHVGASMKKKQEDVVTACILEQLNGVRIDAPVSIGFSWFEKDGRRDPDNISGFGHKVILDALVRNGVLKDDSQKYVKRITDCYSVDKDDPRIEVEIKEV